jgi:hypothetical protein
MTKPLSQIGVRATGPDTFGVFRADGKVIRDGFLNPKVAWMWAAKQGLHRSPRHASLRHIPKREVVQIPPDDDEILNPKKISRLEGQSYETILTHLKAGKYGRVIRINDRTFGVRRGDYRQSVIKREVQPIK